MSEPVGFQPCDCDHCAAFYATWTDDPPKVGDFCFCPLFRSLDNHEWYPCHVIKVKPYGKLARVRFSWLGGDTDWRTWSPAYLATNVKHVYRFGRHKLGAHGEQTVYRTAAENVWDWCERELTPTERALTSLEATREALNNPNHVWEI